MQKVKILDKSFSTTHFGMLLSGNTYELPDGFAGYVVDTMKAGVFDKAAKKDKAGKKDK